MTYAAKTVATSKVLFGKIMATYTCGMGRERSNLYLQGRHAMADVAGDLGVFFSLVIKAGALASSLRTLGLRRSDLQPLKIRRSAFFRVRWETKVSPRNKQARQCE